MQGERSATSNPAAVPVRGLAEFGPSSVEQPRDPAAHRFAHVDTLRAVAALCVVTAHLGERFAPFSGTGGVGQGLLAFEHAFSLGRLGVLLFFAISGFVIYASLRGPGAGSGRRFVITRFFRLYPAYWLSLAVGLIAYWWCHGERFDLATITANATMLPHLLGSPLVLGVYWTLETELAFYGLCWLLWYLGWLESRRVLCWLIVGLGASLIVQRVLIGQHVLPTQFAASWKSMPRHLALMFWGALFRVIYDETVGFRVGLRGNRQIWLLTALGLWLMSIDGPKAFRFSPGPPLLLPSPYAVAPVLFALWIGLWRVRWSVLAWIGRISYSIYLFHLSVALPLITFLEGKAGAAYRGWPLPLYMSIAFVLTTAVSAVIYSWVELPSIALGRRQAGDRPR